MAAVFGPDGATFFHSSIDGNRTIPNTRNELCGGCRFRALPGTSFKRCSRCSLIVYCTKECQQEAWQSHKKDCRRAKKWKEAETEARGDDETGTAVILRAPSSGSGRQEEETLEGIKSRLEFYELTDLGNEVREVVQLKNDLGWKDPAEGGKFYPEVGFGWYFFMYHDSAKNSKKTSAPLNPGAGYGSYSGKTFGDVVISRGSPAHVRVDDRLTKKEVTAALLFNHKTGRSQVFHQREMYRSLGGLSQGRS